MKNPRKKRKRDINNSNNNLICIDNSINKTYQDELQNLTLQRRKGRINSFKI